MRFAHEDVATDDAESDGERGDGGLLMGECGGDGDTQEIKNRTELRMQKRCVWVAVCRM